MREHFECLIVQDFDTDNVSDSDFAHLDVPVFVVNQSLGGLFYKTRLMNFGIALTSNEVIVQQDADILYSEEFLKALVHIASDPKHFQKYLFGAPYFESDDMDVPAINITDGVIRKKGDFVGDTFIFSRPQIEAVRGYDERMRMWHEEEDVANRIIGYSKIAFYNMGAVGIRNTHVTHQNNLRSFNELERKKNLDLFFSNVGQKIFVLDWQSLGGIVEDAFGDKKMLHRDNEGDSLALRENFLGDVYSIKEILLRKDAVVLDIGAHIGCFALSISDRVGEVICYEPDTANFLLLQKNIEKNGFKNISIHEKAVASQTGELELYVNPTLSVLNSLVRKNTAVFSQKIPAISLAEIIGEKRIDLLKIDCEGGEYDIFYNSPKEILKKIDFIVMEYHDLREIDPLFVGAKLVEFLVQNGFEVVREKPDYDRLGGTGIIILKNLSLFASKE